MQDIELVEECRKNAEKGLEYTMNQYVNLIYSIVYGKISSVGTTEDAKECVSDVFMEFYQQLNKINLEKGSIKAFLATIAKYKAIDLYRKLVRKGGYQMVHYDGLEEFRDLEPNPEEDFIKKDEKKMLLEAINTLGEPDKEIFIRKYYMGQRTKEIAKVLDLPDNTVDKKVSRGLKKLRFFLGGAGYGQEDKRSNKG